MPAQPHRMGRREPPQALYLTPPPSDHPRTYRLHEEDEVARKEDEEDVHRRRVVIDPLRQRRGGAVEQRRVERPPREEVHRVHHRGRGGVAAAAAVPALPGAAAVGGWRSSSAGRGCVQARGTREPPVSRKRGGVSGGGFGTAQHSGDAVRHDVGLRRAAGVRGGRGGRRFMRRPPPPARARRGGAPNRDSAARQWPRCGLRNHTRCGRRRAGGQAGRRRRRACGHPAGALKTPHQPRMRYSWRRRLPRTPSAASSSRCAGSPAAVPPPHLPPAPSRSARPVAWATHVGSCARSRGRPPASAARRARMGAAMADTKRKEKKKRSRGGWPRRGTRREGPAPNLRVGGSRPAAPLPAKDLGYRPAAPCPSACSGILYPLGQEGSAPGAPSTPFDPTGRAGAARRLARRPCQWGQPGLPQTAGAQRQRATGAVAQAASPKRPADAAGGPEGGRHRERAPAQLGGWPAAAPPSVRWGEGREPPAGHVARREAADAVGPDRRRANGTPPRRRDRRERQAGGALPAASSGDGRQGGRSRKVCGLVSAHAPSGDHAGPCPPGGPRAGHRRDRAGRRVHQSSASAKRRGPRRWSHHH